MATPTLPSTMRASQWTTMSGGIEKSVSVNAAAALPKNAKSLPADHTLVKVSYATLNPVDYKLAELVGPYIFSKPATPGFDYSGTVVSSTLPHFKTGEEVFGAGELPAFGALGEYVVVGKKGCVPVPNGLEMEQASCIGITGLTAYQCLAPFVKAGDKLLINGGSGGTGTFGIQIAKALGCHVTTTCSGPNVELCQSLGADDVIDYRSNNVVETLKRRGTQFDLVIDNVFADADLYWSAHHYLKPSGKFITIAGSPSLSFIFTMIKIFTIPAFLGGGQRKLAFVTCTTNAEELAQIAAWMKEGKVKAVVEKVYPLEETGEAYARLKSGRTRGKLVVKVSE